MAEAKKTTKKATTKKVDTNNVEVKAVVYKNVETGKEFIVSDTRMISIYDKSKDMKKVKETTIEIDKKYFIPTFCIK